MTDIKKNEVIEDAEIIEVSSLNEQQELTEFIATVQGRKAIRSWFMVGSYTKWLAWGYAIMTAAMIVFALSNTSVEEDWFWPKVAFMIIASALLTFIAEILRMMVYSGKPISVLRDDLLDVRDDEKIVTANNFYMMVIKMLLIPTTTLAVAVVATESHIFDMAAIRGNGSVGALMGLVFSIILITNTIALLYMYLFLRKIKKGNKELEDEINQNYANNLK